jgi:hypothetical protein
MADKTANSNTTVDTDEELLESVAADTVSTTTSTAKPYISKGGWELVSRGDLRQIPIQSVRAVTTGKDDNKVTKYIINELYWGNKAPGEDDGFVVVQSVSLERGKEKQTNVNVVSYAKSSAKMTNEAKIQTIIGNDPAFAMALATLLK